MSRLPDAIPMDPASRRRAFSLVELLLAIFILGIGVISIAALFPAGIAQQRQSVDEVMGPVVANNALSVLRTKLRQGYFGTFEQFNANGAVLPPDPTISGDWPWRRPGFIFEDDAATDEIDEQGCIDVFSHEYWSGPTLDAATEFPGGYNDGSVDASDPSTGTDLVGLPYDRFRFLGGPPRILVSQGERAFPMYSAFTAGEEDARPQFYWECAFRRFQGRVQVAIFVYRVTYPPGYTARYSVTPDVANPDRSPLPLWVDLDGSTTGPWDCFGPDGVPGGGDDDQIDGTQPGSAFDPSDVADQWQLPRQWILDQNNNVHRVLDGRRTIDEGPVALNRPIAEMPGLQVNRLSLATDADSNGLADTDVVEKVWFMPILNTVDTNADGEPDTEVTFTPVFLMVEQL